MPEILETFSTYRDRVEKALQQIDKDIILSTDVSIASLRSGGIEKVPIAWRLYEGTEPMFYVVTCPPDTHIRSHSHNEDIFRFVVKGSLVVNDEIRVSEGMWFVVKANTPYKIDSKDGYKTIMRYQKTCLSGPDDQ